MSPVRQGEAALLRRGFGATVLQDALNVLTVRPRSLSPTRGPHCPRATVPPPASGNVVGNCGRDHIGTPCAVGTASGMQPPAIRGLSSLQGSLSIPLPMQPLLAQPGSCASTPGREGRAIVMSAHGSQGPTTLTQSSSGSFSARPVYKSPLVFRQYSALAPKPKRPGLFSSPPRTRVSQAGGCGVLTRPGSGFSAGAPLEIPSKTSNPLGVQRSISQQGPTLRPCTSERSSPHHCGATCSPSLGSDGSRSRSLSPHSRSRSASVPSQQRSPSPMVGERSVQGNLSPQLPGWSSPISKSKPGSPLQRCVQVYPLSPRHSTMPDPSGTQRLGWQRTQDSGAFASPRGYLDGQQQEMLPQRSFVARGVSPERRFVELRAQERPASLAQPQRSNAADAAYSPSFASLPHPKHDSQGGYHVGEILASGARSVGMPRNSDSCFLPAAGTTGCTSVALPSPGNQVHVRAIHHSSPQALPALSGETEDPPQLQQQQQQQQQ
eukprot:CAMPEP_0172935802 /NCGR_PEP_ID=MMETSP1075-20121228/221699_1 /TAXON_ID=2916 /ORGANISM="Ceratium fusus, Strain PA161109" /LENGTH=492 /DNA_ID=CAMNT_0013797163 /DNA_START=339 /DNA_END=1814 /DNA_ORIENTATION=-